MKQYRREISKEVYDLYKAKKYDEADAKIFSRDTLMGYGIYCHSVSEQDGKYFLDFQMPDSCD